MRQWHIGWRSEEIYGTPAALYVYEVPLWTLLAENVVEFVDTYIFRHKWCCPWEWTFKVPTWSWKRDEDGFLDHSIGGALFTSFQWCAAVSFRREKNRMDVDLTAEWLVDNGQIDPLKDWEDE